MKIQFILLLIFCFLNCNKKTEQPKNIQKREIYVQKNDTISKTLYPNKKIKELIIKIDSIPSGELHLLFYENGNLKEKGYQGIIENESISTGMSIGTWYYYDSLKRLDSTIFFHNEKFGKDFIEVKRYFKTGKLKAIEKYNNHILYQNAIDSIGIWTTYDSLGKVIKSVNYGSYKKQLK